MLQWKGTKTIQSDQHASKSVARATKLVACAAKFVARATKSCMHIKVLIN